MILKINRNIIFQLFILGSFVGVGISFGKVYLFHVMVPLMLWDLFKNKITFTLTKKTSYFVLFPILLCFYYLSSISWAPIQKYAVEYFLFYSMGSFILYTLLIKISSENKLKQVVKWIAIYFTIEMMICFLESISNFRYPISPYNDWVDIFAHKYSIAGNLSPEIVTAIKTVPTGFHWNPNNLASMMCGILPFILYMKNSWKKLVLFSLTFYVLLVTNSRGVLLASSLVIGYWIIFAAKFDLKKVGIGLFAFAMIITISPGTTSKLNYVEKKFSEATSAFSELLFEHKNRKSSIGARQQLVMNGIENLHTNYWTGIGGGNSKYVQEAKGKIDDKVTSMHNFWIETLVEIGLPMFLLFIFWYFGIVYQLFQINEAQLSEFMKLMVRGSRLSLIGSSIAIISCSSVIYFLPFYLLLAISLVTFLMASKQESGDYIR